METDQFKHNNLTDFEKLLFAEDYIRLLKQDVKSRDFRIGELQSEIDELKYILKYEKPESSKLMNSKIQVKQLEEKLKKYKNMYDECFYELIKLKNSKTVNKLIQSLGEPVRENSYQVKPDKDGIWWIQHEHVGSGEPLKQWLETEFNSSEIIKNTNGL